MAVLFTISSILQELSDIKSALNNEIEQLRSVSITSASCKKFVSFIFKLSYFGKYCLVQDFQELRTTLKKQQEDVSLSLKNLGVIAFLHRIL